ncbi:MAG: hypothetical protein AAF645_28465, partial [Myxococcota bacterium]
ELNAPNTLDGCADGSSGSYLSDESLERVVLRSVSGENFSAGSTVVVEFDVWAWSGFDNDTLDVYYAANANAPSWTLIESLKPTAAGAQTLSVEVTLPSDGAALQAFRGQYRYQSTEEPCSGGAYNDRDDLVFVVGEDDGNGGGGSTPADAIASFDATYSTASCDAQNLRSCSTGDLVAGRGEVRGGIEAAAPNTLFNSCADGNLGTYQDDESIEAVRISTVGGGSFTAGADVVVDVDVWAWLDGSNDTLDLWVAADADNPEWVLIGSQKPTVGDAQTLSMQFTLPEGGSRQAVRAVFRYASSAGPCVFGGYTDRDDVVFRVN